MKKLFFLLIIFTVHFSSFNSSAQVPKKIVVEHFTNTKCSICASRNPGFYTNLFSQTDVLHLSIHPSAPYSGCLLYQQNATDNDARTNYYGVYGGTPRLVINGNVISNSADYSNSNIFLPYQLLTTPASIRIVQEKFGSDSIHSTVIIKAEATHSLGNLSLFVSLAEDTVFYTGTNGESLHYNVFRKSLTAPIGMSVTLPAAVGDSVMYVFSSASNPLWDFSRIYTLAILQDSATKDLVQAERASVNDTAVANGIWEFDSDCMLQLYPNPVSSWLTVPFSGASTALVSIYSLNGELVFQKEVSSAQPHIFLQELPSATYVLTILDGEKKYSVKFVKQ